MVFPLYKSEESMTVLFFVFPIRCKTYAKDLSRLPWTRILQLLQCQNSPIFLKQNPAVIAVSESCHLYCIKTLLFSSCREPAVYLCIGNPAAVLIPRARKIEAGIQDSRTTSWIRFSPSAAEVAS